MTEVQLINALIKERKLKKYLDIGIKNPNFGYDKIDAKAKNGLCLNPGKVPTHSASGLRYGVTVREFFNLEDIKGSDLVLIRHSGDYENTYDWLKKVNEVSSDNAIIIVVHAIPEAAVVAAETSENKQRSPNVAARGMIWKGCWHFAAECGYEFISSVGYSGMWVFNKSVKKPYAGGEFVTAARWFDYAAISHNFNIVHGEILERYLLSSVESDEAAAVLAGIVEAEPAPHEYTLAEPEPGDVLQPEKPTRRGR